MRILRSAIAILMALALLPVVAWAQAQGSISGRVVDAATGQPLAGVQVSVAGTTRGANTNQQGQFTITGISAGTHEVRATLVGYGQATQNVTVAPGQTATVSLSLSASAVQLSGIVVNAVTGQEQRRRSLGTNVSNISVDDITKGPITKPADVLTGRAAGVVVQGASGTAGTSQRIRIRGANSLSLSNEPLIYVDGVLFSNQIFNLGVGGAASSRLNDINPDDIANVEILKGPAATSQYGTAAANGVILITTKRGRPGTRWGAYSEFGRIVEPNAYPDNWVAYQVNTPNAPLFRANGTANISAVATAARRTCYNHIAATGACRQDSVAVFNTLEDPRTTPFSDGHRRKYGVNVSGGSTGTTYYLSADLEDEQGVISTNELGRVNVRANLNADVTDRLRVQLSSSYMDSDLSINSNSNTVYSPLINGLVGRAFFNPDTASFGRNYRLFSPSELAEYIPEESVNRLVLGSQANFQAFDWLTLNANAGLDFLSRFYQGTLQPNRRLGIIAPGFYDIGFREAQRGNNFLWTANTSATAEFNLTSRLASTTTAGASFQRDEIRSQYGFGTGIVEGTRDLGTSTSNFELNEAFLETRTIGAFVSQQLAWDDRLFLVLGLRGDDNSAFGADFGFITYPNANLSWVVDEESWFPRTDVLSTLRLRAGYGTSGLRPSFRDAVTLFAPIGVQVAGSDQPAVVLSSAGSSALEPERTTEYEIGFDAGMFGDRINGALTFYNKTSSNALVRVPIPPSFGLTPTRLANLASVRNSGMELDLGAQVLDLENVGFNLRLVSSTLRNKVLDLGGIDDIVLYRGEQRHREGFPAGAFFQDRYEIRDNGDGKIATTEVVVVRDSVDNEPVPNYIGPSLPTFTNALSGDLQLFRFITLSTLFEQRGGNYQLDFSTEFRCRTAVAFQDRGCEATANPAASVEDQARYVAGTFKGTRHGYIHKADFIKWRELSITFGVPENFDRVRFLRGASLTLSGRNLGTWTDYPGLDPEIVEQETSGFNSGEFNTQPPVRYYTARLNFTF